MSKCCKNTLLRNNNNIIKYYGSDLIAVDGANTIAKLQLGGVRIPYKQVLTSKIILKAGQKDYLLNFLGLGDNANLLAVVAHYDVKSKVEPNNYIEYSYFNDMSKVYTFSSVLTLTGNSTNRVKQIYLSNPNINHSVTIDFMVGIIDDAYSFFENIPYEDSAYSNLKYTDLVTFKVNESISILGENSNPMVFISLSDIVTSEISTNVIILNTTIKGYIYLNFISVFDAQQAFSLLKWVMNDTGRVIQDLDPRVDQLPPTIFFTNDIQLVGSTAFGPYDSDQGDDFISGTMSLANYNGLITKLDVMDYMIDYVLDYRGDITGSTVGDGSISMTASNIIVTGSVNLPINYIEASGTYSVTFDISDIAGNSISSDKNVVLSVNI